MIAKTPAALQRRAPGRLRSRQAMPNYEIQKRECIAPRDARGLTEVMSVLDNVGRARDADDLYLVVSSSGREYLVDIRQRVCECPDFQHNLPDGDRHACKHIARVTYEIGARPIPGWINRDALDDQLGLHVSATPRVAPTAVVTDGGQLKDDETRAERPADCSCVAPVDRNDGRELPCFQCWRAGFRSVNPEVTAE